MTSQEKMNAHIEKTLYENNVVQKDTMNGMMKCESVDSSYEDMSLTFGFPLQPWQANRAGTLHGGMIATAFDITIAALARFYAGENFAPTVSLDIKYVRPAQIGDKLIVKATAVATGKRISQFVCEATSEETGKTVATGASIYLNIDTMKEKR